MLKHSLRGRDRELALVRALLRAAADGHGGAVALTGPPGSGRSALLGAATMPGTTRLTVTGCPAETALPGAAVHRLLPPTQPAGKPSTPTVAGRSTTAAAGPSTLAVDGPSVLAELRRRAADGPLVCCVDDVQWLDRPSLSALAYAARRIGGDPIALVLAGDVGDDGLLDDVEQVPLEPLDTATAQRVLRDLVPDGLQGDVAGVLVEAARGNPAALVALTGALTAPQRRGEAEPPMELPAGSPLRVSHRRALAALPPATRSALLLIAADESVLPERPVPVTRCVAAVEASGLTVDDLEPAERSGLVRVDAGAVRFPRPLFGAVVYAEATLAERRSAHRTLTFASPAWEAWDAETVLRETLHRAALADGPDGKLAMELAAAAPPEHALAARALRRAAELAADPADAARHRVAAAGHAWRAGFPHRARLLLRPGPAGVPASADAAASPAPAAAGEFLLAEIELRAGVVADAYQMIRTSAEHTDAAVAPGTVMLATEVLCASGAGARFAGVLRRVAPHHEPCVAELLNGHFDGLSAMFGGNLAAAVPPLRKVLTLAGRMRDPAVLLRAAVVGLFIGDDAQAHRLAHRAAGLARDAGELATVPQALEIAASADLALGGFEAAVATGLEGLRLARTTGQDNLANNHLGLLAVLAAMVGDRAGCVARVHASRARSGADVDSPSWALGAWALSLLDVADGRHQAAITRLTRTEVGRGSLVVQAAGVPTLVEAAAGVGRPDIAAHALRVFEVWTACTANPTWLALAARCRALLAPPDEAEAHYAEALRLHVLGDSDFARARTELLFGQWLRRGRRPAAARQHLERALETFEQFGAGPWAERAGAELRAAGSPVPRAAGAPVATGPPSRADAVLTAQQRRIAGLVADGATNREVAAALYLSPRTVDHHLRNIFVRLGVRSRTELAKICRTGDFTDATRPH
ncbi:LuxR family transcriptional regulator [Dactylosporangium sp. AC04546]|uniref:helix-turn-helix transcriptional regulator n=1 Tax=Dactylosporangium sp. AC04546 TaxID=2862460 RepID=UPI002E7AEFEA|nr:LuxR family transcriptional regulator [Dactylosporangium sp. AC04546]WVK86170.1 LuxR family transcriptional regulator [Dactylosporangium sp. AC04546]